MIGVLEPGARRRASASYPLVLLPSSETMAGTTPDLARDRIVEGRGIGLQAKLMRLVDFLGYSLSQGVSTRGPSAVTATVNSKWAARESSSE